MSCYLSKHQSWFFSNQKTDGDCCSGSTRITNEWQGGTARVCHTHNMCIDCGKVYTDNTLVSESFNCCHTHPMITMPIGYIVEINVSLDKINVYML